MVFVDGSVVCAGLYSHLSLVVDEVEVLSDTCFRTLALDVCSGGSGGCIAGVQAAQRGHTTAAESCSPEEQHSRTAAQRVDIFRDNHLNTDDECGMRAENLCYKTLSVILMFLFTDASLRRTTRKNITVKTALVLTEAA